MTRHRLPTENVSVQCQPDFSARPPDCNGAIAHALARLERYLPGDLYYHNLHHTRDEVLPAAARLAQRMGLSADEIQLVRVAAAYHDIGFTVQYDDHEAAAVRIASRVLPGFGTSPAQIDAVVNMILATRLPQSPRNLMEQILADADFDVLGSEDCWPRNHDLRREWEAHGRTFGNETIYRYQVEFLRRHTYFTPAAHASRDEGKRKNVAEMETRLRQRSTCVASVTGQ